MNYNVSVNTFKRKRKKQGSANPLFEKWLTEWRDEAAQKQWKTKYVYDKALKSLQKFPLPLKSGKEAKILEFFGDKICEMLDRKLAEHKGRLGEAFSGNDEEEEENMGQITAADARTQPSAFDDGDKATKRKQKQYIPAKRSGPYALLVALYQNKLHPGSAGFMKKVELMAAAQPFSEKSFTLPEPGSHYTAWSSMGSLIRKGLIIKEGNPARYRLTPNGEELADRLNANTIRPLEVGESGSGFSMSSEDCITENGSSQRSAFVQSSSQGSSTWPSTQSSVISSGVSSSDGLPTFTLSPGQFEIVLCVDSCETSAGTMNERKLAVQTELRKNGVTFDLRKLQIADYTWIARERVRNIPGQLRLPDARELVLDYAVERKRKDDLVKSIKDGRFNEQKARLKKCGLKNLIYLVEECGIKQLSIPEASLVQAVTNTQVIDGFRIKMTKSLSESVAYLTIVTRYLERHYMGKTLSSCSLEDGERLASCPLHSRQMSLLTFDEFNRNSVKNKPLTVTELFVKQLLKVHGLSLDKVKAIVDIYPTPSSLMTAYSLCSREEGKNLLSGLKTGQSARNLGPTLSSVLYQLYTNEVLS